MNTVLLRLLILFLAVILVPVSHSVEAKTKAKKWTTTEFDIRFYSPFASDLPLKILDDLKLSTAEKLELSALEDDLSKDLTKIAEYFESQGIDEPNLPVIEKAGAKRYVVFAYDFGGTDTVGRALHCGEVDLGSTKLGLRTTLTYNLKNIRNWNATGDRVSLYGTLAHELFHSIQRTYDLKAGSLKMCNWKDGDGFQPTVEGTASAAEALVLENKFPGYLKTLGLKAEATKETSSLFLSGVGLFPYSEREFLAVEIKKGKPDHGKELHYKTSSFWRYLAERYGGDAPVSVFDKLFKIKLSSPSISQRYKWLNRAVIRISGDPGIANSGETLYTVFSEFQAEFASYWDRYGITEDKWLEKVYSDCAEVPLSKKTSFYGEAVVSSSTGKIKEIVENGARCIKLEWQDATQDDDIKIEAKYGDMNVIDQLHLGVAYLETKGTIDSCYDKISVAKQDGSKKRKSKHLECSFGKVFPKEGEICKYKPWILGAEDKNEEGDFFGRDLGSTGRAILILTNIDSKPAETMKVKPPEGSELKIKFSLGRTKLADGRRYHPLITIQLRESNLMPSIPASVAGKFTPFSKNPFIKTAFEPESGYTLLNSQETDRYSIYGIKKPAAMLQSGLGATFQTISVNDPKKKYSILPISASEFRFGYTGPFNGIVSNESNALSSVCKYQMGQPIGQITKSDDEQLRFKISTDLCKLVGTELKKVDSISAEFIFPFGRRAFPETIPQDVITPGLELYIDEYLKELARRGLPLPPTVLLSDGSVPGQAV
ncbi:MAG: hypothetical protein HKN25_10255, partial [Pyrinomonadaceae bacterium]|nr:hypothetical protein [Pyrinomonadaceae bacterium]